MRDPHILWTEIYRPSKIEDCILPADTKEIFQTFISKNEIPNLMLTGTAGTGKTTVARALCDELEIDYIVINGSNEGRQIDTLRTTVQQYCSTVSFGGGRKVVIFDEADYMSPESVQPALRGFIEQFSSNVSFIFTCNFPNRIIQPIHSRCSVVDFKTTGKDRQVLASQFMKRVCNILDENKVEFEKKVVAELVTKHYPDFRRVLNELQRYSATGFIDTGILKQVSDVNFKTLMTSLKDRNFKEVQKWVSANTDTDTSTIFRKMYDFSKDYIENESIPQLVLILAEYQKHASVVADFELHFLAALTEIMADCRFK